MTDLLSYYTFRHFFEPYLHGSVEMPGQRFSCDEQRYLRFRRVCFEQSHRGSGAGDRTAPSIPVSYLIEHVSRTESVSYREEARYGVVSRVLQLAD